MGKLLTYAQDPAFRITCIICQGVSSNISTIEFLFLEVSVPGIRTFICISSFATSNRGKHNPYSSFINFVSIEHPNLENTSSRWLALYLRKKFGRKNYNKLLMLGKQRIKNIYPLFHQVYPSSALPFLFHSTYHLPTCSIIYLSW